MRLMASCLFVSNIAKDQLRNCEACSNSHALWKAMFCGRPAASFATNLSTDVLRLAACEPSPQSSSKSTLRLSHRRGPLILQSSVVVFRLEEPRHRPCHALTSAVICLLFSRLIISSNVSVPRHPFPRAPFWVIGLTTGSFSCFLHRV